MGLDPGKMKFYVKKLSFNSIDVLILRMSLLFLRIHASLFLFCFVFGGWERS